MSELALLGSVPKEIAVEARQRFNIGRSLRDLPLPAWAPSGAKWGVRRMYARRPGEQNRVLLDVCWWHDGIRARRAVAEWQPVSHQERRIERSKNAPRHPPADLQRQLLVYVSANPGAKLLDIADVLGLKGKSSARILVDKMIKTGSLRRDERGVLRASVPYIEVKADA